MRFASFPRIFKTPLNPPFRSAYRRFLLTSSFTLLVRSKPWQGGRAPRFRLLIGMTVASLTFVIMSSAQSGRDFRSTLAYANWLSTNIQHQIAMDGAASSSSLSSVGLQASIFSEAAYYQLDLVTDTNATLEEKAAALSAFLEKVNNGDIVITEDERDQLDAQMGSLMGQARTERAQLREKITALSFMRQERTAELSRAVHGGMSREYQEQLTKQVAYFDQQITDLQSDFSLWESIQLNIVSLAESLGLQMPSLALRQPTVTANVSTSSGDAGAASGTSDGGLNAGMLGFGQVPMLSVDRGDLKSLSKFGG